jgi:hypothetical protein
MVDARLQQREAEELEERRTKQEQERRREEEKGDAAGAQAEAAGEGTAEKPSPARPSEAAPEVPAGRPKAPSQAVLVTGGKNRRIKRGKIVRSALDTSKAKQPARPKKAKEAAAQPGVPPGKEPGGDGGARAGEHAEPGPAGEQPGPAKAAADEYADLSLGQVNELKNQIEQKVYADFASKFLGAGADPLSLKPLCLLFRLKYDAEDPTETVRQLFRKIKARISKVIDLDDTEDARLRKTLDSEGTSLEDFMQSPYVEVCKDVKSRLLMLLEIKPSLEYLTNVTKIDSGKCFSRYGSIKFSQASALRRGLHPAAGLEGTAEPDAVDRADELAAAQPEGEGQKAAQGLEGEGVEHSQHDDEHDDEVVDIIDMDQEDDDGEKLVPLGVERSKSQQIGLRQSLKIKPRAPRLEKGESSRHTGRHAPGQRQPAPLSDQESQGDWLEIHRKWKQWNRFHKQAGGAAEDRDLTSPFCSPLHSVLQFAKNSEIEDPTPLRALLCEQQKRAAFRLFALKHQGKLYDIVQGTPYQRFVWGAQSHSLAHSALDRVETCGEALANKINERSKKLVKRLMSYTVVQADNMRHYQDILEKYLKQQDAKPAASGAQPSKPSKQGEPHAAKRSAGRAAQGKEGRHQLKSSPKSASTVDSSSTSGSSPSSSEQQDRRIQKITFDDFIPWQMRTVMHSLNDLRVLLSDPFTQAHVLEALKEDQSKLLDARLERQMKLTAQERHLESEQDAGHREAGEPGERAAQVDGREQEPEQALGFQNIKQFLKALVQIMLQSNSSSPLAEQFPNSARLCQSAYRVAKIVLSQFVSDKQQIREAETSKILQEMMLEILVSHLEKACGLDRAPAQPGAAGPQDEEGEEAERARAPGGPLARPIEDTNLEEITQLLKLLQEVMRLSSDAQRAHARHQLAGQPPLETLSSSAAQPAPAHQALPQSRFLADGGVQATRCARLLAYLMVEFEVPVIVRHAVRCARIFFFGVVDFEKLDLYSAAGASQALHADGGQGSSAAPEDGGSPAQEPARRAESTLSGCCRNQFLVAALRAIGERISHADRGAAARSGEPATAAPEQPTDAALSAGEPEGSSPVEVKAEELPEEARTDQARGEGQGVDLDDTEGKKYVVYANINSQTEDFTFLVTALYHWEKLRPAIGPTQPADPAVLAQKSTKAVKKEAAAKVEDAGQPAAAAKGGPDSVAAEAKPVDAGDGASANEAKEAASTLEAVAQLLSDPESAAGEGAQPEPAKVPEEAAGQALAKSEGEQAVGVGSEEPAVAKEPEPGQAPEEAAPEKEKAGGADQEAVQGRPELQAPESEAAKVVEQEEAKAGAELPAAEEKAGQSVAAQSHAGEGQDGGGQEDRRSGAAESPEDRFELAKKKLEADAKCAALLRDIHHIESNADLLELLKEQQ